MTIANHNYWQVTCDLRANDRCKVACDNLHSTEDGAAVAAEWDGWREYNGDHVCPACHASTLFGLRYLRTSEAKP